MKTRLMHCLLMGAALACGLPAVAQIDDGMEKGLEMRFNSKEVLAVAEPVRQKLQEGSAAFFAGHDLVLYGLVVGADGYIMTKASDLSRHEKLYARIGEEKYEAPELVGVDEKNDLALVKIRASGLRTLTASDEAPSLGTIVVSNGATTRYARRARMGVISGRDRAIPQDVYDVPYGGIQFAPPCNIGNVAPKSPGEKAGLKKGDVVDSLDRVPVKSVRELSTILYEKKPGDLLQITVKRGKKELDLVVKLASWRETLGPDTLPKTRNEMMSGHVSKRRDGFAHVYEHDSSLPPHFMGGPLLDLDGNVIGLNIARANRVETYALPIRIVMDSYRNLLSRHQADQ